MIKEIRIQINDDNMVEVERIREAGSLSSCSKDMQTGLLVLCLEIFSNNHNLERLQEEDVEHCLDMFKNSIEQIDKEIKYLLDNFYKGATK